MKKLKNKLPICILSPYYFKLVMENASMWSQIPYSTKHAVPAWYYKYFFKKVDGFLLTGFKVDWLNENFSTFISRGLVQRKEEPPTELVFVSKELYSKIRSMKNESCLIDVAGFRLAKIKSNEYGIISKFCLSGASFIRELNDREKIKITSIDAMASLVW